jgi:hypothetical protein
MCQTNVATVYRTCTDERNLASLQLTHTVRLPPSWLQSGISASRVERSDSPGKANYPNRELVVDMDCEGFAVADDTIYHERCEYPLGFERIALSQ